MLHVMTIAVLSLVLSMEPADQAGLCYSAYTPEGTHLIISDNGTPGYYDDDFICDTENNVDFTIVINE